MRKKDARKMRGKLSVLSPSLAMIEWGWVGYEEFCRLRRVLSTYRGQRPRWITPSKICRILHILRKPNSVIALLFIQNISSFLEELSPFRSLFFRSPNIRQPCPQVFSVNGSIICSGLHFRRHFDVMGLIIFGGLYFWRHWFNIWSTAAGYGELCVWV